MEANRGRSYGSERFHGRVGKLIKLDETAGNLLKACSVTSLGKLFSSKFHPGHY